MSAQGWSVLVTGGRGLVGSWLVRALLGRGDQVVVLTRGPVTTGSVGAPAEGAALELGDVAEVGVVARVVERHRIDTVFHLAAQTLVGDARRSPAPTFEANVRGTWLVLEACREAGVARLVVASTDKVYGTGGARPFTEEDPLRPRYPYEASKAAADVITRSYWSTYGLPVAVTRLPNVYGGADGHATRLIPQAIAAALAGRAPVIRSDGTPRRDFLFVDDAVSAYLAVAQALDADGPARGDAFNAGSGRPRSVLEVVRLVCRAADTDLEPDIRGSGTPAGEIERQGADHSKLSALTGWAPRVGLEEGLARTVAWYREHPAALSALG